jgi:hypothetical protein
VRGVEFLRVLGEEELSWFLFVKSWGDAGLHAGTSLIQSHRPIPGIESHSIIISIESPDTQETVGWGH